MAFMNIRLHREGKQIIPISFVIIAVLVLLGTWVHPWLGALLAVAGLVLFGLILYFFRNPNISVSANPSHILSPCDGKVVVIEEVQDKVYLKRPVRQVSIFMSPLNVHVNRNPIGGEVEHVKYNPGKYLMAFHPKSSEKNEHSYIVLKNERIQLGMKQIAGFLARRIVYYVNPGDRVKQGEEFGFIKFGSRIDLLLPLECEVCVELGTKTKAGRTLIAKLPESTAAD